MQFAFRGGRFWVGGAWCLAGACALSACSPSKGEAQFANPDDAGAPVVTPDATAPAIDSGSPPNLNQDGSIGTPAVDSGPAPSLTDAYYSFDGFAHPDGYSEASYCTDD